MKNGVYEKIFFSSNSLRSDFRYYTTLSYLHFHPPEQKLLVLDHPQL